ncbi:amidase [Saccharibacillus sp. O23]|uniref:amidase family protein n=1 Tax=Saccharibacillus sp. O23 TaxID=2009338 RepID=UPI000B4E262A|nr:amidase family protein [Saccharibacillus sp. O23]OWR30384.1 amidase [Saccharibacillus sp. O23]
MTNFESGAARTSWLLTASIDELQNKLSNKELTSRQLVLLYLERIAELDRGEHGIRSIIEINPDAIGIADAMDALRRRGDILGPLHGIPVLVKDIIDTGDAMHTSAGSLALADHYASEDAFAIRRLRKAGAILLGKTNMTEWANLISSDMPAGYSGRGGQTLNPYGREHFVGGSSSGSAAAIASGFAAGSLGTETSASVLSPACQNSLVGIKPTVGLISRSGVIPVSFTQDTIGTLGKTVTDAALLLGVLRGVDPQDPITITGGSIAHCEEDYSASLRKTGLNGLRIGIPRDVYFDGLDEEEARLTEDAIAVLARCGATIVDDVVIPSARESWDYGVAWLELKASLNRYLGKLPAHSPIRSLDDVIAFNTEHAEQSLRYGQDLFVHANAFSGTLTEPQYLNSLLENFDRSRTRGIDAALQNHELDALFFPGYRGADIAARAGYPSIVVPAGYRRNGQPVGVQFTGSAYSEALLIQIAHVFEQATKHRVSPVFPF